MLLDNEKAVEAFPLLLEGRKSLPQKRRAVMVGQLWSADLAEILMDVYSHLIQEGYSLEDVSRMVQDVPHDGPGD